MNEDKNLKEGHEKKYTEFREKTNFLDEFVMNQPLPKNKRIIKQNKEFLKEGHTFRVKKDFKLNDYQPPLEFRAKSVFKSKQPDGCFVSQVKGNGELVPVPYEGNTLLENVLEDITDTVVEFTDDVNESVKNDRKDDKLMWELLPLEDIEEIVKVYTAGAKKYGPNKWQNLPDGYNRYKAAMFRHLLEHEKGNLIDEETGCLHIAQVAWNAIALLHVVRSVVERKDLMPLFKNQGKKAMNEEKHKFQKGDKVI